MHNIIMVNYENGKIYKIESISCEGKVYVGSTTKEYLSQRMDYHRYDYIRWKNGKKQHKLYSFVLFDMYGLKNCKITLLEIFPCKTSDELHAKEGEYIRMLDCVNKNVAGRTKKESQKNYYNNHKSDENFIQNRKEYRAKYVIDNHETIIEKKREFNQLHIEEINKKAGIKFNCECGSCCRIGEKARHYKSKKHQDYFKTQNNSLT